ncbi:MAG: TIGR01244 family phosphatase [Porphyrobacter sp.]|nr:TIGR01244 family phosphatase [Porphyrobacter sp.]
MTRFRPLTDSVSVSSQIDAADVAEAARLGFAMIVNNRPERESPDQTPGDVIAEAARAAGLSYRAIPVTHSGFSGNQVDALIEALDRAEGPVLCYCRSGTRSALLWALACARRGEQPDAIAQRAQAAGYDVSAIRPLLDMFATRD